MTGIIVFHVDYQYDWRPFGAALPAGAVPAEITMLNGSACSFALHGFAADSAECAEIVRVRNEACAEMAGYV